MTTLLRYIEDVLRQGLVPVGTRVQVCRWLDRAYRAGVETPAGEYAIARALGTLLGEDEWVRPSAKEAAALGLSRPTIAYAIAVVGPSGEGVLRMQHYPTSLRVGTWGIGYTSTLAEISPPREVYDLIMTGEVVSRRSLPVGWGGTPGVEIWARRPDGMWGHYAYVPHENGIDVTLSLHGGSLEQRDAVRMAIAATVQEGKGAYRVK